MRTVSQLGAQQCQLLGVSWLHWVMARNPLAEGRPKRYQVELSWLFGSPYG